MKASAFSAPLRLNAGSHHSPLSDEPPQGQTSRDCLYASSSTPAAHLLHGYITSCMGLNAPASCPLIAECTNGAHTTARSLHHNHCG
eukprot:scaffold256449_cov28-Tisochrysis_lutea.AAC.5